MTAMTIDAIFNGASVIGLVLLAIVILYAIVSLIHSYLKDKEWKDEQWWRETEEMFGQYSPPDQNDNTRQN